MHKILVGKSDGRRPHGDDRIILKHILNKENGMVYSKVIWLSRISGELSRSR
jgi:hypothetical protein